MSSSIHKSLISIEQDDVIEWYGNLQQSLEPQGIPLIPFDAMKPKYGTVGFAISGIGITLCIEVGTVLGQLLAGKLLPMKDNAGESELSQLLSIDNIDRKKNGWDFLHTVFSLNYSPSRNSHGNHNSHGNQQLQQSITSNQNTSNSHQLSNSIRDIENPLPH
eukprot:scaffold58118_cov37-Cyclotella_meneghiniana.AAC.3